MPKYTVMMLCAGWCGVCREMRAAWDAAAQSHPGRRFLWIDIEDEADRLDDIDVETFPTIAVLRDGAPHFFGIIPPSMKAVERLLDPALAAQAITDRDRGWLEHLADEFAD
jgi:thioredoxin 1